MSEVFSSLLTSVGASSVLILLTIQLNSLPYTALATASLESVWKRHDYESARAGMGTAQTTMMMTTPGFNKTAVVWRVRSLFVRLAAQSCSARPLPCARVLWELHNGTELFFPGNLCLKY